MSGPIQTKHKRNKARYYLFRFISVLGRLIDARDDITEPRRNSGDGFVDKLFGVCTLFRLPFDWYVRLERIEVRVELFRFRIDLVESVTVSCTWSVKVTDPRRSGLGWS